jgi:hypothetical protein
LHDQHIADPACLELQIHDSLKAQPMGSRSLRK